MSSGLRSTLGGKYKICSKFPSELFLGSDLLVLSLMAPASQGKLTWPCGSQEKGLMTCGSFLGASPRGLIAHCVVSCYLVLVLGGVTIPSGLRDIRLQSATASSY